MYVLITVILIEFC